MIFPNKLQEPIEYGLSKDDFWLVESCIESQKYIRSFDWVKNIGSSTIFFGIPEIFSLSEIEIIPIHEEIDKDLWVVSGDIPSAYFVKDEARDVASAMEVYCSLMDDWSNAVLNQTSMEVVFPVRAENTYENATNLANRMRFFREQIIPELKLL